MGELIEIDGVIAYESDWRFIKELLARKRTLESWREDRRR
jgi:hypothetical protein